MKTYNQKVNGKSFDWNQFLDSAIKEGISKDQHSAASNRAASWVTCACGNQCDILNRDEDGEPTDQKLASLGIVFMEDIQEKEYVMAKATLRKIESRSATLIKNEVKKLSHILSKLGYSVIPTQKTV